MTDRYENIRDALAMGPTPGPYRQSEHTPQRVDTGDGAINIGWACNVDNGARESRAEATAALIAACDPDTIRALLTERDALREALKEIRSRSSIDLAMRSDQFELTAMLGDIHQIADVALAQETKA